MPPKKREQTKRMTESEYYKIKKHLNAVYHWKLEALDIVFEMSKQIGVPPTSPRREQP